VKIVVWKGGGKGGKEEAKGRAGRVRRRTAEENRTRQLEVRTRDGTEKNEELTGIYTALVGGLDGS